MRSSALSAMPGIEACPARALGLEGEPEHALLTDAQRVVAAPVDVDDLAGALVHDPVAANLVRARSRTASARRSWRRPPRRRSRRSTARRAQASIQSRCRRPRPPPRRRPDLSCRARLDPRRSRHAARRTTGRRSTRLDRPAPCRRGTGSRASYPPSHQAGAQPGSAAQESRRPARTGNPPARGIPERGSAAPRARCPAG